MNQQCELYLVGGAALVLLYESREATKDVDAFASLASMNQPLRAASAHVASQLTLPADWLNDAAKGFVQGLALGAVVIDKPGLRVRTLAPQQLLAMKLSAWRDDVDIEDARLLLGHLSGTRQDIWGQVEPHIVPGRDLKARYAFDDLWEADHAPA
jgi:Nucleotidyltransferase of unknown function (DUF6036)